MAAGDGDQDGTGEGGTREWYGDSAYGTGDLRGAIDDAGHDAVIKPKPLQAPVEGGFTVDEQAGTVGCPAGHTRPLSRTRVASFGALCRGCPLRERCTKSKTGRKIVLHQRDALLRQVRRDWAAEPYTSSDGTSAEWHVPALLQELEAWLAEATPDGSVPRTLGQPLAFGIEYAAVDCAGDLGEVFAQASPRRAKARAAFPSESVWMRHARRRCLIQTDSAQLKKERRHRMERDGTPLSRLTEGGDGSENLARGER